VCNLACTSFSLINNDNIANIANIASSAYVFDDVVSCTDYLLPLFVRHNLYIALVLSNFNNAISGTNRFLRGSSSAYSIDLSDDGFDWLAMLHVLLHTWGYGGNRFWRAKWAALDIDCVDFLQCYDLDFCIPNRFCHVLSDRFLHIADLLIAVSTAVLFKHFNPVNYFHLYFAETFLINQFSAMYFACLSYFLADSNSSASVLHFNPPPPWLSSIRLVFCVYSHYFSGHAGTGDHAICSQFCLLWHYIIPFLSHCHEFNLLFSTYVPRCNLGHFALLDPAVCGSGHSRQASPALSVNYVMDSCTNLTDFYNFDLASCVDINSDLESPTASLLVRSGSLFCNKFAAYDAPLFDYLLHVCNNNKFFDHCSDSETGSRFSDFVNNITSLYPDVLSHLHIWNFSTCSLCPILKPLFISILHSSIGFLPHSSIPVSSGPLHHSTFTVTSSISSYVSAQAL
jgi:hypothetical protein